MLETFSGVRFVSNDKNVLSELQSFYCLLSRLYRPVSFEDGGGGQGGGGGVHLQQFCVSRVTKQIITFSHFLKIEVVQNVKNVTIVHFVNQSASIRLLEFYEPMNSQRKPASGSSFVMFNV